MLLSLQSLIISSQLCWEDEWYQFAQKNVPSLIKYKLQIQTTHQIINFTTVEGRNQPLNTQNRKAEIERERETQRERDRDKSEREGGSVLTGGAKGICWGLKRWVGNGGFMCSKGGSKSLWRPRQLLDMFSRSNASSRIMLELLNAVSTSSFCNHTTSYRGDNNLFKKHFTLCSNSTKTYLPLTTTTLKQHWRNKSQRIKSFDKTAGFYLNILYC